MQVSHHSGHTEQADALHRYPTTVATLSRRARDVIEAAFEESAEAGAASPLLPSRLHDFGFRGCCTVEQSVIGGAAHLLNFTGTDTLSAAYYVQVWEQALATSEWLLEGLEALSAVPLDPLLMQPHLCCCYRLVHHDCMWLCAVWRHGVMLLKPLLRARSLS